MSEVVLGILLWVTWYSTCYATALVVALGWKHGRGVQSVTNITVNATPTREEVQP